MGVSTFSESPIEIILLFFDVTFSSAISFNPQKLAYWNSFFLAREGDAIGSQKSISCGLFMEYLCTDTSILHGNP